jgi:hypothetical protein
MATIYCDRSQLPARRDYDHYPTPQHTVLGALGLIEKAPGRILDVGAGDGTWGRVARQLWPACHLEGIEVRFDEKPSDYDEWHIGDFAVSQPNGRFDLVMGNPPYSHAENFVRRGYNLLSVGGSLVFLLRLAFLEGQARRDGLFHEIPPYQVAVCSKRPSFSGNGRTNATAFAVFHWRAGYGGTPILSWLR